MTRLTPDASFEKLLAATSRARLHVRQMLIEGTPQLAEPEEARWQGYLFKRQANLPVASGSEALIGNTTDYQNAAFLAVGAQIRRAVAYIEINLPSQARLATGFLISNTLFMTNHHVITSADDALSATVFFDRELNLARTPLPMTSFRLDPQRFFATSPTDALDYTVVAVGERISGPAQLADLGYCPISPLGAKHVLGMNINILQHPNGQYKQVALRNNVLTFRGDHSLLYETDTEVGSSGSPVFNDLWELVALHHWGQAYAAKRDIQGADALAATTARGNEGIRISVIHDSLTRLLPALPADAGGLLQSALDAYRGVPGLAGFAVAPAGRPAPLRADAVELIDPALLSPAPVTPATFLVQPDLTPSAVRFHEPSTPLIAGDDAMHKTSPPQVRLTIPLEITISLGGASQVAMPGAAVPGAATQAMLPARLTRAAEAIRLDTDYSNRTGYASDFLPGLQVLLPGLSPTLSKQVAPLRTGEAAAQAGLLNYQHFSLVMHKTRRVAIFTATNIDGDTYKNVNRKTGQVSNDSQEGDTWFKDTRISESFYLGQSFYSASSDYFDRGHLTRRSDPTWGTPESAERANADTFHFTNCAPQHFRFNQSARYWQGVERYVLETGLLQATGPDARLSVLQGPIYNDAIDLWMDNQVQIPSSFWKVVVWKGAQGLKAVGMVVDQLPLLSETRSYMGQPKDVKFVDVAQWRVAIADIGKRTGLLFSGGIIQADTLGQSRQPQPGAEADSALRINRFEDILL